MEPTNLPNASEMSKLFITILLYEKRVQAALGGLDADGQSRTVAISLVRDFTSEESSLVATDEVLQDLGPDSENVDEVIFGLNPDWITAGNLDNKHKPFLKKLTENLSLKPIGFVLTTEALTQYLLEMDKYLSAICLYCRESKLHLLLFKQGKILTQIEVGRSGDLLADVHEALARLIKAENQTNQLFPAKMLLVSSAHTTEEIQEHQQQILNYQWTENYPFLQMPTVEILSEDTMIKATVGYGGKAVFGGGAAKTSSQADQMSEAAFTGSNAFQTRSDRQLTDMSIDSQPARTGVTGPDLIEPDQELASSFGVPVNLNKVPDVLRTQTARSLSEQDLAREGTDFKEVKMGKKANVLLSLKKFMSSFKKKPALAVSPAAKLAAATHATAKIHNHPDLVVNDARAQDRGQLQHKTRQLFAKSAKKGATPSHKVVAIFGAMSGLVTLLILGWAYLSFASKVFITLKPTVKVIAKEVQLTLDPKAASSDSEKLILKASIVKKELSAEDSWQASGVKLVGEKASGTVTIFNKTDSEKTFASGTVFKTDKYSFTLNEDVKVASASSKENSSGDGETKNYGKSEVKITAAEIGADYNLAKGIDLTIASFASGSYLATTKDAFSGGSSREIRAVSAKDQKDLLEEVTKKLLNDAEKAFKEESGNGKYLVPTGQIKFTKKTFSADVGEEVDTFTLKAAAEVQAVSYLSEDLKPLVISVLSAETPQGYKLQDEEPEILSSPSDSSTPSSKVKLNANVSLKAKPEISVDDLRGQIVGKTFEQAKSVLEGNDKVDKVEIVYQPSFAKLLVKTMPKDAKRVIFEVKE